MLKSYNIGWGFSMNLYIGFQSLWEPMRIKNWSWYGINKST